jgi:hypothetical protein
MIAMRMVKIGIAGVAVIALLAIAGATPVYAEALFPWWAMTDSSRPTSLKMETTKNQVLELSVSATGGEFTVVKFPEPGTNEAESSGGEEFEPARFHLFAWNASAETVQKGLEEMYDGKTGLLGHKVEVSGGPNGQGVLEPYKITFPAQSVALPTVSGQLSELIGGKNLSGGKAEASLVEVEKGAPTLQTIVVAAQNRGDAPSSGLVTIADQLPKGLEAVEIEANAGGVSNGFKRGSVHCSIKSLICTYGEGIYVFAPPGEPPPQVRPADLPPFETLDVRIAVRVLPGASSGEVNAATVSGGGAAAASVSRPIELNGKESFGIEDYQLIPENVGGTIDTQAGSHPFQLTSVVTLNSAPALKRTPEPVALPKDIVADLPPGLIGNPTPLPQCTDKQFAERLQPNVMPIFWNACPPPTAVGVASVVTTVNLGMDVVYVNYTEPIFNMQPLPGEPARFGFKVEGLVPVVLDTSVRTGGDYGVTVSSHNIVEINKLMGVKLTFWGVPGDPRHNAERGWACLAGVTRCEPSADRVPPPFLGLPTSCEGPFQTTVNADSWGTFAQSSQQAEASSYRLPEDMDGCGRLPFAPSITVAPDVSNGSSATGLTVGVHVAQTATLNPEGLAESTLKNTTVTLPEGVTLDPAGANGLEACSNAQIGFTGVEPGSGIDLFSAGLPQPFCPDGSKVGTVKIRTPLLPNALEGAVYLAAQNANPFNSLVALYIVAKDPVSGVLVKLPGVVRLDESTGRILTTFENTPELPFEDLELHFFGGERAPLGTPALCGSYTTEAAFTPWSGNETAHPTSTFNIVAGPNGSPCHDPLPFQPSLTAGTTSIQAGGFSPFTMTMGREDGNQDLKAIQLHMPPGLLGTLSTVKLCGEAQANAGTCSPETQIGETTVSVGLGGDPFTVTGGKVYITGPYKGAPFGLSIVNPAKAGPFDLGQVVVRAKIDVDPSTAALTVTTDTDGPYKIPTIIDGIPLEIKHINVNINRSNFTFNPTNCSPLAITGALQSAEGSSSSLAVPFQVTNCAVLAFKPKLTASASGQTSRVNGASFKVKLSYPAGPYDANISRVKVELPKQLPSRLTTLQKACTAATFEANPANCPAASIIGHATATTPVLPVPLSGPAYFVSHGGEAFPSLIVVLQGYGVTVHLVGSTFISKQGITSSTFKTVPDVPVGTFELTLPQGPFSALTANANLCKRKLAMPTEFVGQNGALIKTSTKIAATGCAKAKKAKHRKTKRAARGKQTKRGRPKTR